MISNILEQEDVVKGMPDAALQQEAQVPSGMLQQFLVISEIKRRTDMRKRHQNQMQEQPQGTVAEQIVMEGITGIAPQQGVGMPPQMGPQQMPPQGGPQMPPQMPPQGMPPQMSPQMPPQQPPPGMPPMAAAAGGIMRMANGGQARIQGLMDILAVGGLTAPDLLAQGYTMDEINAAQNELRQRMTMPVIGADSILDAGQISDPVRTPQMGAGDQYDPPFIRGITDQMPSLSGTSPEQARFADTYSGSGMPSLSERAADVVDVLGGGDMARARTEIASNTLLPPQIPEIQRPNPPGMMGSRAFDTGVFSDLSEGIAGLMPDNPARSVKDFILGPFADNREMIAAADRVKPMVEDMNQVRMDEQARLLADLQLDAMEGDEQVAKLLTRTDATSQGEGVEVQPNTGVGVGAGVASGLSVQDPKGQPDAITRTIEEVIETQSEGESPARASYNSAIASIDQLISDLKNKETQESPALDLSDIIDRSKRMTEANVLMQLGSGILAGDTAKGIQRASEAGLAGTQQVANLEMKERIAKTQAGREDIRRGEQRDLDIAKLGIQKGQLEMMDTRLANELNKAERVSKGQLFNLVSDLVGDATDDMMAEDRLATVDKLSAYFMQKYAPLLGISLTESDLALLGTTFSGAGGGASGGTRAPLSDFAGG